jgi:nucleoside-diphosphate-sugar epimerase
LKGREDIPEKIFIIGCGDIGRRVASLAGADGIQLSALVRPGKSADKLKGLPIATVTGDLDDQSSLGKLELKGTILFYLAPPPGGGVTDPRMRSFCAAVAPGEEPLKVIYVSTSGVYGDCGNGIVTEETPVNPQTTRARRRLDAETTIRKWGMERSIPVVILRVAGIYGPGRLPVSYLESSQPVINEEEAPYTNRIHADDLARICLAAAARGEGGDIFNVSDGQTGTMTHYFNAVADLLGLPRPPQVSRKEAERLISPLMLSYMSESRRMDNSKMLDKLGIELLYPTLEEGLHGSTGNGN